MDADDKRQHIGATTFVVEGAIDGLNLASKASHAVDYFVFLKRHQTRSYPCAQLSAKLASDSQLVYRDAHGLTKLRSLRSNTSVANSHDVGSHEYLQ
jgi:hypothetical protein